MKDQAQFRRTCDLISETQEEFIRIRSGIERLVSPVTQQYGLTTTQVAVLNLIRKSESATVSSLFRALDFNQGNMSSLCKKLEADGFIEKMKCPDDERKTYLSLTDKGIEALNGIDNFFDFDSDESDSWLSAEEFHEAERAVLVLRNAARKINKKLAFALSEKNGESNA